MLGEIYAQGLAAAGYKVKTELNLGDEKIALKALEGGEIDAYPEYTGTALGSFFGVKSDEIPKDPQEAFEEAKAGFAKKKLTALPADAVHQLERGRPDQGEGRRARGQEDLRPRGQVGRTSRSTAPGVPPARGLPAGPQQVYGLKFKKFMPVAIDLRHEVLDKGQADLSIVFTTDPQIKRNDEVLLEDDKGMFPPYNSTLVVRDDTVEKAGPDLREGRRAGQQGPDRPR